MGNLRAPGILLGYSGLRYYSSTGYIIATSVARYFIISHKPVQGYNVSRPWSYHLPRRAEWTYESSPTRITLNISLPSLIMKNSTSTRTRNLRTTKDGTEYLHFILLRLSSGSTTLIRRLLFVLPYCYPFSWWEMEGSCWEWFDWGLIQVIKPTLHSSY